MDASRYSARQPFQSPQEGDAYDTDWAGRTMHRAHSSENPANFSRFYRYSSVGDGAETIQEYIPASKAFMREYLYVICFEIGNLSKSSKCSCTSVQCTVYPRKLTLNVLIRFQMFNRQERRWKYERDTAAEKHRKEQKKNENDSGFSISQLSRSLMKDRTQTKDNSFSSVLQNVFILIGLCSILSPLLFRYVFVNYIVYDTTMYTIHVHLRVLGYKYYYVLPSLRNRMGKAVWKNFSLM